MVATRQKSRPEVVVIVGETASGKSGLAIKLAEKFNGEIISADSRTIYQGMDIGTAKPSQADRLRVPHHMIDIRDPDESFTVADFKSLAQTTIKDIERRGRMPIIVGGSGLYVDALMYDFQFREPGDPVESRRLQSLSVEQLQAELIKQGIALPENSKNPRYLARKLETNGTIAKKKELRPGWLIIGLRLSKEISKRNIEKRVEAMFQSGLPEETRRLAEQYGWDIESMKGIGYREFKEHIEGDLSIDEVKELIVTSTMGLAKKQRTWFKRNPSIQWFHSPGAAYDSVCSMLNNS